MNLPVFPGASIIGDITIEERSRKGDFKKINCKDDVGEILEEAGERETVIITDINLAEVEKYREEVPVIRSRRLDIYDIRGY